MRGRSCESGCAAGYGAGCDPVRAFLPATTPGYSFAMAARGEPVPETDHKRYRLNGARLHVALAFAAKVVRFGWLVTGVLFKRGLVAAYRRALPGFVRWVIRRVCGTVVFVCTGCGMAGSMSQRKKERKAARRRAAQARQRIG